MMEAESWEGGSGAIRQRPGQPVSVGEQETVMGGALLRYTVYFLYIYTGSVC